jgi:hypothetical protein
MRHSALAAGLVLSLTGCMVQPPGTPTSPALNEAMQRFPPMILGANVTAVADPETAIPPSCPKAGSRVEQKGGPTILFLGISNGNPDLCHMKLGDDTLDAWFGIWGTTWPGAADAYPAIRRAYHSRTGEIVGFDTIAQAGAQPGVQWHDLIRNDGVEEIPLLGKTYRAVKLAHYREGFGGNRYRSVATLWVDLNSGLPVYATYQHIAGRPELDSPLIPTAIVPAP